MSKRKTSPEVRMFDHARALRRAWRDVLKASRRHEQILGDVMHSSEPADDRSLAVADREFQDACLVWARLRLTDGTGS